MSYQYSLKIECDDKCMHDVTNILGKPSKIISGCWELTLNEEDSDPPISFIEIFLDIIEDKFDFLAKVGISKSDVSIWMLYEYQNECNMEFEPSDLKRLGINEISLCISCWLAAT